MPKVKTHSGAKKRFSPTATGKFKRKHAFKRHNLSQKTTKQKRGLTHTTVVHEADKGRVRSMLNM